MKSRTKLLAMFLGVSFIPFMIIGYILSSLRTAPFNQDFVQLFVVVILAIIAVVMFSFILAAKFTKPLGILTSSVLAITEGKFDEDIEASSHDELGMLTAILRTCATQSVKDFSIATGQHGS